MAEMVIHCLPHRNPHIGLKQRFHDIHTDSGLPNHYNYGTPDGRWRYDMEIMTTILEMAEDCFDYGKMVESIHNTEFSSDTETQMDEDSDDDVVEIENFNPIILEPTIEISSDTEVEPETNDEVNSELKQNNEDMEYESDPEEDLDDFDDPNDQDFTQSTTKRELIVEMTLVFKDFSNVIVSAYFRMYYFLIEVIKV
ncbi:uncharacterized protein [Spinacia oleracea]|uniref:Uncharacterized protein n=1 Tax=Spinacia oleracea TaxID=3562 RepID=A0ABM3RW42_SPIOL|nr:uncharacterized protein LOC110797122 [Spinacia oleracea]XP_056699828.1 uncharacterized protein LOC110797122 [Spinacia oleracea]